MQNNYEFELLNEIGFQSAKERREILSRGLKELQKGNVSPKALKLGEKYRKEIEVNEWPLVSIRYINDNVGHGVFAEELLKADCYIGEYTGIVRENTRIYFVPLNNYCFQYPVLDRTGRNFVIDGTKGNFTRFINHSPKPNLQPAYAFVDGFYHLIIFPNRDIQKGEQLSYDYGESYWYIRSRPEELS